MSAPGARAWVVAAGWIPPESSGPEPEYTSREELAILNASTEDVTARITVFHTDRDPVGPYEVTVAARRTRSLRVNDLIDPEAVPLGRHFSLLVEAESPVVVQQVRFDTRRDGLATLSALAYPVEL